MRPLLLLLALSACTGGEQSPFLRVEHASGRIYYAHMHRTLHSEAGGFLTFKDLVTREPVKLENGTYVALICPRSEIEIRQVEYLRDGAVPRR